MPGRTRKRYLGRTETLRLSRLEETAQTLLRKQEARHPLDQGGIEGTGLAEVWITSKESAISLIELPFQEF
jgi:hypothetical protein